MTVEDITNHKIRYNLDSKSRKRYYICNRMYCYAMLFYMHKWSLSRIGDLFNTDHATVLSALKKADYVQHYDEFIEHTELLQQQTPNFIIPKYTANPRRKKKSKSETIESFNISFTVNKKEYIEHIKNKDLSEVYEMLWQLTIDKLNSRIRKINKQ